MPLIDVFDKSFQDLLLGSIFKKNKNKFFKLKLRHLHSNRFNENFLQIKASLGYLKTVA